MEEFKNATVEEVSTPTLKKTRSFSDVIVSVTEGKRIHKLEWKDKEYYGFLNGNTLSLHKPDGNIYQWLVNDGDILGTDWIVL